MQSQNRTESIKHRHRHRRNEQILGNSTRVHSENRVKEDYHNQVPDLNPNQTGIYLTHAMPQSVQNTNKSKLQLDPINQIKADGDQTFLTQTASNEDQAPQEQLRGKQYWTFEAIEQRIRAKKERKILEMQIEELKTIHKREMIKYTQDEDVKQKYRDEKLKCANTDDERKYWTHLFSMQREESFKAVSAAETNYKTNLSNLQDRLKALILSQFNDQ
ncbi:hypothetical protein FGO68_gene5582 [Halteria grandinella]|uniref:Uncharacterized protein n=1 Tax=Halteria grandinella TaxID=5974 RepID=A0A8J8P321_HALGN|nr:hypothetical protein FGO68_gene5582 [Halteria grandinella]